MAITKRPAAKQPVSPAQVDAFINAAPDALPPQAPAAPDSVAPARKRVMRGKREQISHSMPPALLERVDQAAQSRGITRAAIINLAVSEYLESISK